MRTQPPDGPQAISEQCERVIWREEERRCELWIVDGRGCLRLFDGERMLTEEPVLREAIWGQAMALRSWRPGRGRRHDFGFRER